MERALTGLKTLASRKSVKDLATPAREWSTDASAYELLEDCGRGVSATVHRAIYKPTGEVVAIKKMNLESMNCDLDEIIHEAQTMRQYNHPNVLPLYTSFVNRQDLWMVMPLVSGGSVLHIMKYAWPEGLDEVMIATIMREVLKALEYVHKGGGIHRDVKAGNILIDKDGSVKLADFGVAATLERGGEWGNDKVSRNTFVGTPCWMAPEVMEQTQGYGTAADIWSFGITLLEMAHGHAPFARFPPMKVLLMTIQNPPPTLDDKGKHHFSKSMREVVTKCLTKEVTKRPSATALLEHKFFKQAKDEDFICKRLLGGLPSLAERVQQIRNGHAATSTAENDRNHNISQEEYKKGVSSWNFDLTALKAQAAMEPDDGPSNLLPTITENDETVTGLSGLFASGADSFLKAMGSPRAFANDAAERKPSLSSVFAGRDAAAVAEVAARSMAPEHVAPAAVIPVVSIMTPTMGSGELPMSGPTSCSFVDGCSSPSRASSANNLVDPSSLLPPLAATSTPMAVLKQKKQGRFHVWEPGADVPPMSPPQDLPAFVSMPQLNMPVTQLVVNSRISEDGVKSLDVVEALNALEECTIAEPRQRGRFKITEEGPKMSKPPSMANLAEAGSRSGNKSMLSVPALATAAIAGAAGVIPAAVLIPRLQELLDHTNAQSAALGRFILAAAEVEKGGGSSRGGTVPTSASYRSLQEPLLADDDTRAQVLELKQKLLNSEEELSRARSRCAQLETVLLMNGITPPVEVPPAANNRKSSGAGDPPPSTMFHVASASNMTSPMLSPLSTPSRASHEIEPHMFP